jgi:hypothetical protein
MIVSLIPTLSWREREMWSALRATFIVQAPGAGPILVERGLSRAFKRKNGEKKAGSVLEP